MGAGMGSGGRTIALLVEYDGSAYHGSQLQENAPTVQGALERALDRITGEANRVAGAGRTDTGVHAAGQVMAFTTASRHSPETFVEALNFYLAEDIAVRAACEAPTGFDPRRDARSRRYRYLVLNRRTRPALARSLALWVRQPLDDRAMNEGAGFLAGRHDMASFCAPPGQPGGTTVREVFRAEVGRTGDLVYFDMEANAFLPQQVRRTMGVILEIGRGAQPPDAVRRLLERPVLGAASSVAPPHGLCLMEVVYPEGLLRFPEVEERSRPAILDAVTALA